MKVRYVGKNIGATGLTDGKIYNVLEIDELTGALRIIDDSEEECGYLYSPTEPKALAGEYKNGKFEVIEDDEKASLARAIKGDF